MHKENKNLDFIQQFLLFRVSAFLGLDRGSCVAVYAGSELNQKYLNLCSKYEQRFHGFLTTWGWVFNDRIFYFWVNNPFNTLLTNKLAVNFFKPIVKLASYVFKVADYVEGFESVIYQV